MQIRQLKQQWKIEDISIFSNSSHLEWRAELPDTILKGTHLGIIPARFVLIWFSGFSTFKSSPLKPLNQIKPNLADVILSIICMTAPPSIQDGCCC
jgi:hypothetical protein